jgi:hypothetical protein
VSRLLTGALFEANEQQALHELFQYWKKATANTNKNTTNNTRTYRARLRDSDTILWVVDPGWMIGTTPGAGATPLVLHQKSIPKLADGIVVETTHVHLAKVVQVVREFHPKGPIFGVLVIQELSYGRCPLG